MLRASQDKEAQVVSGAIEWRRSTVPVSGVLQSGFVPEGGRVLVELCPVHTKPPEWDGASLWVDLASLDQDSLELRSELWELPEDDSRDYALRTLFFAISDWLRAHGARAELRAEAGDASSGAKSVELALWIHVPCETALDHLQAARSARGTATARPVCHTQGQEPLYLRDITEKDRPRLAQNASHLARLFTGSLIRSVFRWQNRRLYHIIEISLSRKHEKLLVQSFGMIRRQRT